MAVFRGLQRQRGHGLGNVIRGAAKVLLPLLARHLASFKKEAIHSGVDMAGELMRGENPKKALKSAFKKTVKGTLNRIQSGGNMGRKRSEKKRGLMGRWVKKNLKKSGPPGKRASEGYKRKRKTKKKISSRKSRQQKGSTWGILQ